MLACRQILVVMGMLVRVVHPIPAACGLASTIALIPFSIVTGRKLASIRKQLMQHSDARIKLCSEVVTGVSTTSLILERTCSMDESRCHHSTLCEGFSSIVMCVLFYSGPFS